MLPADLADLTATGFRDTTRIAAGDPSIWTGIFVQNRSAMVEAVAQLEARITQFKQALIAGDPEALDALLAEAKKVRDALGS
jgi:prephenate dehydrogenase